MITIKKLGYLKPETRNSNFPLLRVCLFVITVRARSCSLVSLYSYSQ